MVNPDGLEYDLGGGPYGDGAYRGWRKNRQPTPGSVYRGTDLNRNYGYDWAPGGSPKAITYPGPHAWSAPEVRAVRDFVLSRRKGHVQRIRTHITFHTTGQLVMWPYSRDATDLPPDMTALDHSTMVAMGRAMAATNGYRPLQSGDLGASRARRSTGCTAASASSRSPSSYSPGRVATSLTSTRPMRSSRARRSATATRCCISSTSPTVPTAPSARQPDTAGRCTTTSRSTAAGRSTRTPPTPPPPARGGGPTRLRRPGSWGLPSRGAMCSSPVRPGAGMSTVVAPRSGPVSCTCRRARPPRCDCATGWGCPARRALGRTADRGRGPAGAPSG